MKQHRHPTMAGAFQHAWDLVKALSTEDLRMAARTGGIQMTPERRQAYADASLPLNTGGGFRTMPEAAALRLIHNQRNRPYPEVDDRVAFDPRSTGDVADALHQPGNLDMDDRLYDKHHMLTQGQSMPDPMEIQEAPDIGTQGIERVTSYGTPIPDYVLDRAWRSQQRGKPRRSALPIDARPKLTPGPTRTASESTRELSKPFTSTDPPRNPESEFSRRGDAGASPSDKAFKIIQQRKDNAKRNAERMEEVRAERQREMMMQRMRDKMKSRTPPQARGRRREGPNQRKMRLKREAERRKNR